MLAFRYLVIKMLQPSRQLFLHPCSYYVVFDTFVEDMPKDFLHNRPWNPGDNLQKTVWEYLKTHPEFQVDKSIRHKLLITVAPDSYLQRVR
ncbi:MAG: hypothetical protein EPN17_06355 [Methylobacter sp.]|nr:MAG: hypothetical protein EPN17_06355 [Methylobacter sp.]